VKNSVELSLEDEVEIGSCCPHNPITFILLAVILMLFLTGCLPGSSPPDAEATPTGQDSAPPEVNFVPVSPPIPSQTPLPEPASAPNLQIKPEVQPSPELTAIPGEERLPAPVLQETPAAGPGSASLLSRIDFGPWDHVLAAAWSPDGELLAASAGENVHLIAYPSLEVIHELRVGASTESLAFSPAGSIEAGGFPLLALAVKDGSIQLWDPSSGDLSCSFQGHRNGAKSLSFFPDGRRFATTGMDAMVRVWDVYAFLGARTCPLPLQAEMIGSARAVPGAAVHPGGTFLASIDLRQIRLREIGTQRIMGTITVGETVHALSFSPDGRWLAGALGGDVLRVWEVETLAPVFELTPAVPSRPRDFNWSLAFSPSGGWLVAGSSTGAIRIWQVDASAAETQLNLLEAHQKAASSLAFHPYDNVFVSGGLDGQLIFWSFNP
jgi:WD40 repeat protein